MTDVKKELLWRRAKLVQVKDEAYAVGDLERALGAEKRIKEINLKLKEYSL